jgi:small subunit ribosomal protein S17
MADEQNEQIEETEGEPVQDAPADEVEPQPEAEAAVEPSPEAAEADESSAEADEPVAEEPPAEPESAETAETTEGPATSSKKRKKKRVPRALRPARTKIKREKPSERKPTSRLPKPEHAKGRRQERQGTVVSAAMDKTIVVRVDLVKAHPRYKKVIRRSSKFHAHDEQNEAKVGDVVLIVETRPLSRTKRWRLQKVVEAAR